MRVLLLTVVLAMCLACAEPPATQVTSAPGGSTATAAPVAPVEPTTVPTPTPVLFQNVRVFDGTSDRLTGAMNVLVTDHTIAQMNTAPIAAPAGAQVIDGRGRTLMPGLIDAHVHVLISASSQPELLDPKMGMDVLQARATEEAKQILLRGVTAVRDLGGPLLEAHPAIDRGALPGPRIYPSGAMISQTSGHGDFRLPSERARRFGGEASRGELLGAAFIADGRDEVLTATRENLRAGATQIKVMAGGGAASAYDPLDVSQYTLDEMKAAVEAAEDWGTYVAVHAYTKSRTARARSRGEMHRPRAAPGRGHRQADRGPGRMAQPAGARRGAADGARDCAGIEARGRGWHRQRVQVGQEIPREARLGHGLPVRAGQQQETRRLIS